MAQSRLKAARADWARSAGGLDLAGDFRTKHKDGLGRLGSEHTDGYRGFTQICLFKSRY